MTPWDGEAKIAIVSSKPSMTVIEPAERMWVAEEYHQDYYRQNKRQGYCRAVIAPKLDKLGLEK